MNNSRDTIEHLTEFALSMGEIMLVSGAEMARVEDTVRRILKAGGLTSPEVFALPTGIFVGARDRRGIAAMNRVTDRSTNLFRICRLNQLSREFCSKKKTLKEAEEELLRIKSDPDYGFLIKLLGYALCCGFFAVMFGGGAAEVLAAAGVGLLLCSVLKFLSRYSLSDFIRVMMGAFTVGLSTLLVQHFLWTPLMADAVLIGAIMPLVPGATLTTGIRDTINGDYSAGTARIAEAVVTALAVATGVAGSMMVLR